MNKETYEALKVVIEYTKKRNKEKWGFYNKNSEYFKEITAIENWIEEYKKEIYPA